MARPTERPVYRDRFDRYFQDELTYLREVGAEFAAQDPGRAHFDFAAVDDPDVKCLLEGFSFLTARIRQTLDGDLPELAHSILRLTFPQVLRPLPPLTVLEFTPKPGALSGKARIERGAEVEGPTVDGTRPVFRTTTAVEVLPIELAEATLERPGGRGGALRLVFRPVGDVDLAALALDHVRLYVRGEAEDAGRILSLLRRAATRVRATFLDAAGGPVGEPRVRAADEALRRVGFDLDPEPGDETALLPWPARAFDGHRLLQEFLAFPEAFRFLDVEFGGLESAGDVASLEVRIALDSLDEDLPRIDASNFGLHCAPAVNLFEHDADPIVVDHRRTEYVVRPQGAGRAHYEIFAVEGVTRLDGDQGEVPDFHGFAASRAPGPGVPLYHEVRLRPSTLADPGARGAASTDTFLRFVTEAGEPLDALGREPESIDALLPPESRVAVRLLCSNRHLAERIAPGQLDRGGRGVPPSVTVRGIEPITRVSPPALEGGALWRVQSLLALNGLSLDTADRFRALLEAFDARSHGDERARQRSRRRLDALLDVRRSLETSVLGGAAVRVVATEVDVDLGGFAGIGELDAFGLVLAHFLRAYVALGTLSRLTLRVPSTGLLLEYPACSGLEGLA